MVEKKEEPVVKVVQRDDIDLDEVRITAPGIFFCELGKKQDRVMVEIRYKPKDGKILEFYSLCEYLKMPKYKGCFESYCTKIADELYEALQPVWIEVTVRGYDPASNLHAEVKKRIVSPELTKEQEEQIVRATVQLAKGIGDALLNSITGGFLGGFDSSARSEKSEKEEEGEEA